MTPPAAPPPASQPKPELFAALVEIAHALDRRFPDDNSPFQRISRLAEETGELAAAVNHTEGMGIKHDKHGPPDLGQLTKEIQDVLRAAIGLAIHYDLVDQLIDQIHDFHDRYRRDGYLTDSPALDSPHSGPPPTIHQHGLRS